MIKLEIEKLGRKNFKEMFQHFDSEEKYFKDIKEAKEWIKEEYGNRKREKMYIDTKDGTMHVGYVIRFKNSDISHIPTEKWYEEDWISFYKEELIDLGGK